jgi:hypothetical protein
MDQGNNILLRKACLKPAQNLDTGVMERNNYIGHPTCEPHIILLFSQHVHQTLTVESQLGSYQYTTRRFTTRRLNVKAVLLRPFPSTNIT